ncbi:MAG: glycosyltransferase [Cyclobacteriaceae bacterium]|nr:glycosyltransferase [Cyclobacteriaceae bacterium]
MPRPLVSVVCLCYNHAAFVEESILSVIGQTYPSVELIVVDDASTDHSVEVIAPLVEKHGHIKFMPLAGNIGNCAAFNKGFERSRGQYIIDLAADDVLLPDRIERGVEALEGAGNDYGVQFSDAQLIDTEGNKIGLHSDTYPSATIPQGDIYKDVVARYFISGPTMLVRRQVFETLNGYDEALAYEDFDFWARSSRLYKYLYIPQPLVKRRVLWHSMKSRQFVRGSDQLRSTFAVCQKINEMNNTPEEKQALAQRIHYEIKVCLRLLDFGLAIDYFRLLKRIRR